MSYQTLEALKERKLDLWLDKGIITKEQYKDLICHCVTYGFWSALGYATKLKYKNNPKIQPKYIYKWVKLNKKDVLLNDYITTGAWSKKRCKRRRVWYNCYYYKDNSYVRERLEKENLGWEIFFHKQNRFLVGLRKRLLTCSVP